MFLSATNIHDYMLNCDVFMLTLALCSKILWLVNLNFNAEASFESRSPIGLITLSLIISISGERLGYASNKTTVSETVVLLVILGADDAYLLHEGCRRRRHVHVLVMDSTQLISRLMWT